MSRRPLIFAGIALALTGCGDPAPSTKLAPDVPTPDSSKFSQEEISKFHEQDHAGSSVPR